MVSETGTQCPKILCISVPRVLRNTTYRRYRVFFAFGASLHTFRSPLLWHRFTPYASLFTLLFCGLTELLLWIQLVAEGSLSNQRALGVAITRARYNFVEGSVFGLRRAKGSVKSKENPSKNEGKVLQKRRRTRTNENIALRAGLN